MSRNFHYVAHTTPETICSGLDGTLWVLKYDDAVKLDGWIRRRLRMCYWKQWGRPRRRIRELIKLGVSKREAIRLGLSRKSYWLLSKTLATNCGLSNTHFEKIGLISVCTLWRKIHHPATAR